MALKIGSLYISIGADTAPLDQAQKRVSRSTSAMEKGFNRLGSVIAIVFSIQTARNIIRISDNMLRLEGRIRNLVRSDREFNKIFAETLKIANELGIAVDSVATTFQRFAIVKDNIGANNEQMLKFSETIQKLGIISGATGQEVAATSIQISQALANNFESSSQEINSIREQMIAVALAVEEELGLIPGSFKKAMSEGEVSAIEFFNAILRHSEKADQKFKNLPVTAERAWNKLSNNIAVAIDNVNKQIGGSSELVGWIDSLSEKVIGWGDAFIEFSKKAMVAIKGIGIFWDYEFKIMWLRISGWWESVLAGFRSMKTDMAGTMSEGFKKIEISMAASIDFMQEKMADFFDLFEKLPDFFADIKSGAAEAAAGFRESAKDSERLEGELEDLMKLNALLKELDKKMSDDKKKQIQDEIDLLIEKRNLESLAAMNILKPPPPKEEPEPIGDVPEIENQQNPFVVDGIAVMAGQVSGVDQMLEDMGDETQALLNALRERNQKILEATREGEEERNELIRMSREKHHRDMAIMEQQNIATAIAVTTNFLDQLYNALSQGGKKQGALLKALFLATKALHVAEIIVNTEVAAAKTMGLMGPFGIPLSTAIRASGYASAGLVAGMAIGDTFGGGRLSGGDVYAGMAHPINEDGNPEILQQGARQFLLPGNKGGRVIGHKDMQQMGSGGPKITVNNMGDPIDVSDVSITRDEVVIMIKKANQATKSDINKSLATGSGETSRSLRQGFDLQRNIR